MNFTIRIMKKEQTLYAAIKDGKLEEVTLMG